MSEVRVRPEELGDSAAIVAVHAAAFPSAAEARLVDALRASGELTVSLVAEDPDGSGQIVGHVALSPVTVDGRVVGLGLGPIGVLPSFQRRGVGAALMRAAQAAVGERLVVLLGDPAYYARFGFQAAYPHGLVDAYSGGDAFQVWARDPRGLGTIRGDVRYAAAFESLDVGDPPG